MVISRVTMVASLLMVAAGRLAVAPGTLMMVISQLETAAGMIAAAQGVPEVHLPCELKIADRQTACKRLWRAAGG